jgi:hypothetical protein
MKEEKEEAMIFVYIDHKLKRKLKMHCINNGRSIKGVIKELISNYLKEK